MLAAAAFSLGLLFAQAATPAALAEPAQWGSARFQQCVATIESDPEGAYESAMAWANEANDLEAFRCAARALIGQGRFDQGARRLESLGTAAEGHDAYTRAGLFTEAGHAYLQADDPSHARGAFTRAIASIGNDTANLPDLLIDRASAYAEERDWRNAEEDLNRSLDLRPDDAAAYRMRAMVRMRQNALDLALADAERAVALDPRSVDSALVLGHVRETRRLGHQFDEES
ncbi:MAG: hypothetical protein AB7J28_15300 [Hyphomonadaceae bacterium]